MGERKVLNFYISPDFDASIIPKSKRDRTKPIEVRMMLPFSLRCNTCGEYMYAGKKFNSKSEIVQGEDYLGIRIFRFIIKCSVCAAEITFKTDPKNSDYACESGASRNFELWRDTDKTVEEEKRIREEEDKVDVMKSLENRTIDNKVEMDILDALDEIKAINQRHQRVDADSLIRNIQQDGSSSLVARSMGDDDDLECHGIDSVLRTQESIDEEIIRSVKFKSKASKRAANQTLSDSESVNGNLKTGGEPNVADLLLQEAAQKAQKKEMQSSSLPIIVRKKKKKLSPEEVSASNSVDITTVSAKEPVAQLASLLSGYGSDSD